MEVVLEQIHSELLSPINTFCFLPVKNYFIHSSCSLVPVSTEFVERNAVLCLNDCSMISYFLHWFGDFFKVTCNLLCYNGGLCFAYEVQQCVCPCNFSGTNCQYCNESFTKRDFLRKSTTVADLYYKKWFFN